VSFLSTIFSFIDDYPFWDFQYRKGNYGTLNIIIWMLGMYLLALIVNYANFLIKKKFAENIIAFLPFVATGLVFFLVWIIMEFLKSHYFQVLFLIL
jgi:hypothetical protein